MPKNLTVRLDDDTREKLELVAERELRPLANQIVVFVKESLERYAEDKGLQFRENFDDEQKSYFSLKEKHSPKF